MKRLHIGCSTFYNRFWRGVFYPDALPSKQWFSYYASHFDTFEINSTFYKSPTLKIMQNWYERAPSSFLYAVKAPKTITHLKRFENCEEELDIFYKVCREGLREKLGCFLFQLPPSFSFHQDRLERIISQLNPDVTNVVEFRNASWWRDDVKAAFTEHNILFCSVSYPNLPEELTVLNGICYLRLHGKPRLFYSEYHTSELEHFLKKLPQKSFVYFNNTANESGIKNAVEMLRLSLSE